VYIDKKADHVRILRYNYSTSICYKIDFDHFCALLYLVHKTWYLLRETEVFLWNWVFTLECKTYSVFADFNWVLVKFIWVSELFSYIKKFLIGYSIIPLLIDTPCLKINWEFKKNHWVNTPKKQLTCFSDLPTALL